MTYLDLSETIDFAIVFMTGDPPAEPEPEEEEEEEEVVEEPEPEPASEWDGWKSLLAQSLDLGSDSFQLPDPITTPGYVPTPPKA